MATLEELYRMRREGVELNELKLDDLPREPLDPKIAEAELAIREMAEDKLDADEQVKRVTDLKSDELIKQERQEERDDIVVSPQQPKTFWDKYLKAITIQQGYAKPQPIPTTLTDEQQDELRQENRLNEIHNEELKKLYGEKALSIPNESWYQAILYNIGQLGIQPQLTEGFYSIPLPEKAGQTTSKAVTELKKAAKSLPDIEKQEVDLRYLLPFSSSPGAVIKSGLMNAYASLVEGEASDVNEVYGDKVASTVGEMLLGVTAEQRGYDAKTWWDRGLQKYKRRDDIVSDFQTAAKAQGLKPNYSGLDHFRGLVNGDAYSTATSVGMLAELAAGIPTFATATKPFTMSAELLKALPTIKNADNVSEGVAAVLRNLMGTEIDIAAAEMVKRRRGLVNKTYRVSDESGEVQQIMKELADEAGVDLEELERVARRGAGAKTLRPDIKVKPGVTEATVGKTRVTMTPDGKTQIDGLAPGPKASDPDVDLINKVFGITYQPSKLAESVYVGQKTGLPLLSELPPQQEALVQLIGEAHRVVARRRAGSDKLKMIASNVWVTPQEADEITSTVRVALEPLERASIKNRVKVDGVNAAKLSSAEAQKMQKLATDYNVPININDNVITLEDAAVFREAVIRKMAGRAATQQMILPKSGLVRSMGNALMKAMPANLRSGLRSMTAATLGKVMNLDRARLTKPALIALDEVFRKVSSNSANLLSDINKYRKQGLSDTEVFAKVMDDARQYKIIEPEQVQLVQAWRQADNLGKGGVKQPEFIRRYLKSNDEQLRKMFGDNVVKLMNENLSYAKRKLYQEFARLDQDMTYQAKIVAQSLFQPLIKATRKKGDVKGGSVSGRVSPELYGIQGTFDEKISALRDEKARILYEKFFYPQREIDLQEIVSNESLANVFGEEAAAILKDLGTPTGMKYGEWLTDVVLQLRNRTYMSQATEDLIRNGFALKANDPAIKVAKDLVTKPSPARIERILSGGGTVAETRALNYLRRTGLDEFVLKNKGMIPLESRDLFTTGRDNVTMVPWLQNEIRRMRELGLVDARAMTRSKLIDNMRAFSREAMTLGYLMVKPWYMLGNLLSVPEQLVMTQGGRVAGTVGTMFRHPLITGKMVMREARGGVKGVDPDASTFVDGRGNVWSVDELHEVAQQYGINRTYAKIENGKYLMDEMLRSAPGVFKAAQRVAGDLQDTLRKTNDALEYQFRVGTFLDALKRGEAPAQAARRARESLYDYSTLTPFERSWGRLVFTFYTFIRKNMDAFWTAAAKNPQRIALPARFYAAQPRLLNAEKEQFMNFNDQDIGRIALGEYKSPTNKRIMHLTPSQSIPDAMFLSYNLLNLASYGGLSAMHDLAAKKSGKTVRGPTTAESFDAIVGQTSTIMPFDPGSLFKTHAILTDGEFDGIRTTEPYANRIPRAFIKTPIGHLFLQLFEPEWIPDESDRLNSYYRDGDDVPGYYALVDRGDDSSKKAILTWQWLRGLMGGMQPVAVAERYIDFLDAYGLSPVDLPARPDRGAERAMSLATSVQREIPSKTEAQLRKYEEKARELQTQKRGLEKIYNR